MTALVWDKTGERIYQTGIDRGVLYLHDGTAVPWNGLVGIEESSNSELKSFYLDGVKYLENLSPGDFLGKLRAYTYPEEFDAVNGIATIATGLEFHDQPPSSFSLSYRTKIGNDVAGFEYGYKLHILYNILAKPEAYSFDTQDSSVQPIVFGWTLTGTPQKIEKFRPTVHISIDSRKTPVQVLKTVEDKLYGTATVAPSLPPILELAELFGYLSALIIIDNGDGTWLAVDESNGYITMLDDGTFQIANVDATYADADTYEVSSTNA